MKENRTVFKTLTLVSQIGITMLTAILLCGALGYYLDNRFGWNTMIFFLALGVMGGYRATYSLIKQFIGKDAFDDQEEDESHS